MLNSVVKKPTLDPKLVESLKIGQAFQQFSTKDLFVNHGEKLGVWIDDYLSRTSKVQGDLLSGKLNYFFKTRRSILFKKLSCHCIIIKIN